MTEINRPTDVCREAFEAWLSEDDKWPSAVERDKKGDYKYAVAMNNWTVWQAAWEAKGKQNA